MNNALPLEDRLDLAVDELLRNGVARAHEDAEVTALLGAARELQLLPRPDFKERLALELEAKTPAHNADARALHAAAQMLPTLFGGGMPKAPMSRMNLAASLLVHAVALSLILSSTFFVAANRGVAPANLSDLVVREIYTLPPSTDALQGGGSGGDRSKLEASHGALPKLDKQQLAPPSVTVRNEAAHLEVLPSIIVPINIPGPRLPEIGDPTVRPMMPSNGTGERGGIGDRSGTGVGGGNGPGFGIGSGGGMNGGVFKVGAGGVTAPRQVYAPDPDYSEEARKVKHQGSVVLWMIVGADGRTHNIKVQRSLGMGLDEKAIEAVKTWRFEPAKKDGQPVNVQINVEVFFRLY